MLGVSLRDKICNEEIYRSKVKSRLMWHWVGNVCRRTNGYWHRHVLEWRPYTGMHSLGRPAVHLIDNLKIAESGWVRRAEDCVWSHAFGKCWQPEDNSINKNKDQLLV
uniref:Endonuclease-reverse transcriptase n=1 Tax=Pararge aegeria TaxID=116150 RepID=S4PLH8_9NEOP